MTIQTLPSGLHSLRLAFRRSLQGASRLAGLVPSFGFKTVLLALLPLVVATSAQAQNTYPVPYTFTTLAGSAGSSGAVDDTGTIARFDQPMGLATDAAGNVYVADSFNEIIRKITPAGVVSTFSGIANNSGSDDGALGVARYLGPAAVAVDTAGNVYVADLGNHTIRKITAGGVASTLAGTAGLSGTTDATGAAARFNQPSGIAVDSAGNVYVADTGNHTVRKITPAGVVTTIAGIAGSFGTTDGALGVGQLDTPSALAVDGSGNVYVADYFNHSIRLIAAGGGVSTFAGLSGTSGSTDGTGSAARFNGPSGLARDSFGNLYVADTDNRLIRRITTGGVVTTLSGSAGLVGTAESAGSAGRFNDPVGIAVDSLGNVYVADTQNHTVRVNALATAPTINSGTSINYGDSYTATATGGTGSGTLIWALGSGSTASSAAINSSSGVVTASSTGTVVFNVRRAGDGSNPPTAVTSDFTLTIAKATQATLSVNSPASGTFGTAYTATATGGSGTGGLTWALGTGSTAPGAAIDSSTGAVTSTGAGTVVINVTKATDTNYLSATSADFTVTLGKATATVTLGSLTATYDGGTHVATATTNPSGLTVFITYDGAGTPLTVPGSYAVVATISDANYQGSATGTFVLSKASQTSLSVNSSASGTFGTAYTATATGGTGSGGVTWALGTGSTAPGAAIDASTGAVTSTGAGTVVINVTKATDMFYLSATSADFTVTLGKATPSLTWATPAGIDYGTPLSGTQLNATANVAGTFTYSPAVGFFPLPGTNTLTATFTPTDSANYTTASAQSSISVTYQNDDRIPAGFDVQGYYARNQDVQAYYQTNLYGAWQHYYNYGLDEGRQFDTQFIVDEYLLLNTDLSAAFGTDRQAALVHWLTYGRPLEDRIGRVPIGFDVDAYLARYPDLAAAFGAITPRAQRNVTVWNHYIDYGVLEGRSDGDFEAYGYLATNADLATVFGTDVQSAAWHWYFYGRREGRRIPSNFDTAGYRTRNPDVVTVWGNDLYGCWLHFRDTGVNEGRVYDDLFRVLEYRARYADVQTAYGSDLTGVLLHWLYYGKPEGRLGRNP